eukprot:gb/GEZN01007741.1/.p1 GENE.gb/GEZN01007741.1/~~gb/GEZN01007741.1/.p1  ORF type:complete len:360 (-),score=35.26 gb/GEZN01007741.1/:397-1476(-)
MATSLWNVLVLFCFLTHQRSSARTVEGCTHHSNSQRNEELFALLNFFKNVKLGNGTFVEIGGLDGVLYSNSLVLERCLGWRGLLIEGNPDNAKMLVENRPTLNITKIAGAVCEEGLHHINFTVGGGPLAGRPELMSEEFKQKYWNTDAQAVSNPNRWVTVPCKPIQAYLDQAGFRHVDIFFLDTEGSEWIVANTWDLSKTSVSVVMIEADGSDAAKDRRVRQHFEAADMICLPGEIELTDICLSKQIWRRYQARRKIRAQRIEWLVTNASYSVGTCVWVRTGDLQRWYTEEECRAVSGRHQGALLKTLDLGECGGFQQGSLSGMDYTKVCNKCVAPPPSDAAFPCCCTLTESTCHTCEI